MTLFNLNSGAIKKLLPYQIIFKIKGTTYKCTNYIQYPHTISNRSAPFQMIKAITYGPYPFQINDEDFWK